MRRRRNRQHPIVRETPLHRHERKSEQQQQRDAGHPDRQPAPHHELARPVPEQLLDRLVHGFGAAQHPPQQPTHIERVEPRTQQHDRGRCQHNRRGRDEGHRGDPGIGERPQKVHREQSRGRHRQCHGDGGEQHGTTGCCHGADQCLISVTALGQLVAIAAEDQQRVVDGQRHGQRDAQVERKDRHVGGERDEPQHRHGADDAQRPDGHRQRRGQQPTEHPDQHQEGERDRHGLHQHKVFLVLLIDLCVFHRRATGAHGDPVTIVDELVGQGLGIFLSADLAAFEVDHDQPRFTVGADQVRGRLRRCGPRRGHVVEYQRRPLQLADQVRAYRAGLFAIGPAGCCHHNHHLLAALPELVAQHFNGVRRLGSRILETTGRQAVGDGDAEDRGSDEHQDPNRDDPPGRRDGHSGNPLQHVGVLPPWVLNVIGHAPYPAVT